MVTIGSVGSAPPPVVIGRRRPPRTRGSRARTVRSLLVGLAFVLPTLVLLGYFMYYPAVIALAGSFTDWDGFNAARYIGLDNFEEMFTDPGMGSAAVNNVIWAIGKIALSLIPPLVVAEVVFALKSQRLQYAYRLVFVIPIIIPAIVTILVWTFYYRTNGR